jgi:hypothetical protein
MKSFQNAMAAIILMAVAVFASGCKPEEAPNNGNNNVDNDVIVTTYEPQDITWSSAKCGGDVIVAQGLSLSEIGVCWSMETNPTIEDVHLSTTDWNTPFVCTMTALIPNTVYHVRAYALRGLQCYYGEEKIFTTGINSGGGNHHYIDFGLPSGTLWATCNVGADSPEDYGDYFAWAEVMPKSVYDWNTYKYSNEEYNQSGYGYNHLTKYCSSPLLGYLEYTDNLTILQSSDDAATVNWGPEWHTPTKAEWEELIRNTTSNYETRNGVTGRSFSANQQSIFIPFAGHRHGDRLIGLDANGSYWSSSLVETSNNFAWYFVGSWLESGKVNYGVYADRTEGLCIRPVRK